MEMHGLDPSVVEHQIDTWLDIASIRKNKHPLQPSKVKDIKAKIYKLHAARFIYPIVYSFWVLNLVLVNKK